MESGCTASILRVTLIAVMCSMWSALAVTRTLASQLEVPLDLDYRLLDAAVRQRFYAGPGGRAQFWSASDGCGHFYATNPRFSRSDQSVQLASQGDFEAAIALAGQCLNAMSWAGNLVATASPRITDFTLRFRVTDLNFYSADGAAIGGGAFTLIKNGVIAELGNFSYDLGPHFRQLQALADELPPTPAASEVKAVLASLRLATRVVAQDDGIEAVLQMDVPESLLSRCGAPLTVAQRTAWREAAKNIGALLTTMATQTQALMPDAQLRDEVAQVAADSRARVALAANAPPMGGDPIPLFSDDWRRLRAALKSAARRGALRDQTEAVLVAVTTADVLFALDQRAPGLGCQLSRANLQPLAGQLPVAPRDAQ
jgi:hypothetical protein